MFRGGRVRELRILGEGLGAEIGSAVLFEIGGYTYFPIHDIQGSLVTMVYTNGKAYGSCRYTAFGEELTGDRRSPWRFASKRYDEERGFVGAGETLCPKNAVAIRSFSDNSLDDYTRAYRNQQASLEFVSHCAMFMASALELGAVTKAGRAAEGVSAFSKSRRSTSTIGKIGANFQSTHKITSVNEVLSNPKLLKGWGPGEIQELLGTTPGWQVEKLAKGSHAGQGWVLREYTPAGHPTGRMVRWHPGGGHHGPSPYWRVTGGMDGKSGIIPGGH